MVETEKNDSALLDGVLLENRYRIRCVLGAGGMSRVYRADAIQLGVPVAVKENLQFSEEAQAQFKREARLLARLSHPNIARVLDYFVNSATGHQCLVMEFVEGENLGEIVKRLGPLSERTALAWLGQILDAIQYLHNQRPPVIHRDIKPSNIKITPQEKAILVDFGVSKVHEPGRETVTGMPAVTAGYAPPEQYSFRTSQRSDIYAFGATLYTAVTGCVPPEAPLRQAGEELLIPPRQLADVSTQVEQVILRAMELDSTRRWQSIEDLRSALDSAAVPAEAPSASAITNRRQDAARLSHPLLEKKPASHEPWRSRKKLIGVVVGLALSFCVVVLYIALLLRESPSLTSNLAFLAQPTLSPTLAPPTPTEPVPTPTSTPTPLPAASALPGAELRAGPGSTFEVVASLNSGEKLTIVSRYRSDFRASDDWYQVNTEAGLQGWVWGGQLQVNRYWSDIPIAILVPTSPTPRATPTPAWLSEESFASNNNGWQLISGKVYLESGALHINQSDQRSLPVSCGRCGPFDDFTYTAEIEKVEGPDNIPYGLTFRDARRTQFAAYSFFIDGRGYWSLMKSRLGKWEIIEKGGPSRTANPGNAKNILGVVAAGTEISLVVNREIIATVTDDTFASGFVGLIVGSEGVHIRATHLSVIKARAP